MWGRFFKPKRQKASVKSKDLELFERRMNAIKKIASDNMATAQYGKHFPVRDNVVVPWEDLLRIWDIADKAKWETPVS